MNKTITFDKSVTKDILNMFNLSTDKEGYIINKNKKKVKAIDKKPIKINEFAGICKSGLIRNDLCSLIDVYWMKKGREMII